MISRSTFQRAGLLVAVVALSVWLFYIGKGYTLFIDNYTVTLGGQELKAIENVAVSVDGGEREEMGKAERVQRTVSGPSHRITIEVLSGEGQGKKVEQRFSLPMAWDSAVVSIPGVLAGLPQQSFTTQYTPPPREDTPAEKTVQQADSDVIQMPGTTPAPPPPPQGTPAPIAP